MAEEFLSDSTGSGCPNSESGTPERKPVRVIIMGSREDVIENIHSLHALGYADVGAWSPLQQVPKSSDVMSILTRYRQRQRTDSSERKSGR